MDKNITKSVWRHKDIKVVGAKMLQDEGIQIVGLPVTSKSAN